MKSICLKVSGDWLQLPATTTAGVVAKARAEELETGQEAWRYEKS